MHYQRQKQPSVLSSLAGPVIGAMLLAVGGLMTFGDILVALAPPAIMYGMHLIEANLITPLIVGHRLTISPVLILISLSFWGWIWGTTGALLAVPLLSLPFALTTLLVIAALRMRARDRAPATALLTASNPEDALERHLDRRHGTPTSVSPRTPAGAARRPSLPF